MYWTLIRNDIRASKLITAIILLFVTVTSLLFCAATMLTVNLTGSIDTMMKQARTPHFMQMHSGELDREKILAFASSRSDVEAAAIVSFVNMENSKIVLGTTRMDGNVQDNGICVQNKDFDFLLDLNGNRIEAKKGEIYVPICYRKQKLVQVGDTVTMEGYPLRVAGFLRDSQMNSLLASSKRFLVSQADFDKLKPLGREEFLIEFRLKSPSMLQDFEQAYVAAGLDANGPTVTYPLFRMLNGISDGLVVITLLFISLLVVAVAFLCIRFTLLAKMEDEYREIGVMKAIGLHHADLKRIYLVKYRFIAAIGCLLGFVLSMLLRGVILSNIRLYFGESNNDLLSVVLCLASVGIVYGVIVALVKLVLRRFKRVSILEALRMGISVEQARVGNMFILKTARFLDANAFLGIKDVLSRKRLYITMFVITILTVFITLVPRNLYTTISSGEFITFMGTGKCDVRIDLMQEKKPEQRAKEIKEELLKSGKITKIAVLDTKGYSVRQADGTSGEMKITSGDIDVFPVKYSKGRSPRTEHEIALSVLNAKELDKSVGDTIALTINHQEETMTVSGIYSDITNGGKTSRAIFKDSSVSCMASVVCADFADSNNKKDEISKLKAQYPSAKVSDTSEYVKQTMGTTIQAIGMAAYVAIAVSIGITVLVVALFVGLLIAKDRYSHAILKALGFNNQDLKKQYLYRIMIVSVLGIIAGTILANTLGETMAGMMIRSFGASAFKFTINPWQTYLLFPVLMGLTAFLATLAGIRKIGDMNIAAYIKES